MFFLAILLEPYCKTAGYLRIKINEKRKNDCYLLYPLFFVVASYIVFLPQCGFSKLLFVRHYYLLFSIFKRKGRLHLVLGRSFCSSYYCLCIGYTLVNENRFFSLSFHPNLATSGLGYNNRILTEALLHSNSLNLQKFAKVS